MLGGKFGEVCLNWGVLPAITWRRKEELRRRRRFNLEAGNLAAATLDVCGRREGDGSFCGFWGRLGENMPLGPFVKAEKN